MNTWVPRIVMALALVSLPAFVAAQPWADGFDAYANGSGLHNQGGWRGWDGNPAFDAFVTNAQALSIPHSVDITPTSDIVQQFAGANTGTWIMTGWCYIPSGSTGDQYFILLNTYNEGGPNNWSTQILFDSDTGLVSDADNPFGTTFAIVNNQWVEVRVEIDLLANNQDIYYDGALLNSKSWTEGASGGGVLNIEALDLFSAGGSSIYWDDVSLFGGGPISVEQTSWGSIKSRFR